MFWIEEDLVVDFVWVCVLGFSMRLRVFVYRRVYRVVRVREWWFFWICVVYLCLKFGLNFICFD